MKKKKYLDLRPTKDKIDERFCKQKDRHNDKLICGYPLPCPHHTLTVIIKK